MSDQTCRDPAPFTPREHRFTFRGRTWRITVRRYWLTSVPADRDPDLLCWVGERMVPYGWERIPGDDIPLTVAKRAARFYREVTSGPDLLDESVPKEPSEC